MVHGLLSLRLAALAALAGPGGLDALPGSVERVACEALSGLVVPFVRPVW